MFDGRKNDGQDHRRARIQRYDLSALDFVEALNLLNEKRVKLQSGTRLVSKYPVIVAEDPSKALEHLRARNIGTFVEP
jgi:hypothetical protein